MATAAKLCGKCAPKRKIDRCFRKKKTGFSSVKNVLNSISSQLTGINTNLNNNINNLSTVINDNNNSLNNNFVNSLNILNTNFSNTIETNTNTIISNMNNAGQEVCTIQTFSLSTTFQIPCGTTITFFEKLSSSPTNAVQITVGNFFASPCQPILVIVTNEGTVIEEPITASSMQIRIDNYSSISIRCESAVPPPADAFCFGFIVINELFCVCC